MQQTRDRDDGAEDIGAAFADPAFADLKARDAPFAILRPAAGDGSAGEVVWANAAAAAFWGRDTPAGLAEALFGTGGTGGRGGWLDGLARGLVPDRPPRLARAGLGRGFSMRARTALIRAWTDRDGAPLIGLAVPDAGTAPAPDGDAWRRPAWAPAEAPAEPLTEMPAEGLAGAPAAASVDEGEDGAALARRGHLSVLRDRLSRAVDGAATLRVLWRTDAAGTVTAMDAATMARLGSPLRFENGPLVDAVARFDPAGAERLRAALASRATFAGVGFDLPVADAAATVVMALGGSPAFGPGRGFAGFRGFGTVDLSRLALSERPRGREAPAGEAGTAGDDAGDRRADRDRGTAGTSESAPAPAPEPAPPPEPVAAAEPAPRGVWDPSANVVQLRAFQPPTSGRFGAVPMPPAPETAPAAGAPGGGPGPDATSDPAEDAASGPDRPRQDGPRQDGPRQDGPLNDQLAFLALGEALRARIGGGPVADGPVADEPVADGPVAADAPPRPDVPEPVDDPGEASDEPASALLDRLPIPVLATVGGRAVFANPAAAARLGYPDARALTAAMAADAAEAEADRVALRDASGRIVPVAFRRVEVPWAGREATLWLLTEPGDAAEAGARPAPRAEPPAGAAMVEPGERSVELLDRVDDAVALLDAAGRLRRLNRRGEAWFGRLDPDAAPGRELAGLLAPESRAAALALLGEVRDGRDGLGIPPLRRDVVARTAEGAAVPMLLTVGRLGGSGGGSGGASGFYATLRDVSALQRAEVDRARIERDRARAADRLPDLLAKVSHEIRTPLGSILGFAEIMMDERFGPLGNPRYKDYLKDIHASGAQVVALVDDLLDLSRIEAGQLDLDVAAVDINRVVTEAVAQMQPEAHRERVIMRTSLAGRIPSVLADERSARQIVRNLLSNAVKFNEPGGQVIVSTAPGEGEGVLLRVRDTGVGMSDEAIAAALEPFGGLSARDAAAGFGAGGTGNGLGLPLTRALVGANGASMTIRSRPREGTLVEVSFAAAEEGGARRPA